MVSVARRSRASLVLGIRLCPFVFPHAFRRVLCAPFMVSQRDQMREARICLALSIRMMVGSQHPFRAGAENGASVNVLRLVRGLKEQRQVIANGGGTKALRYDSLIHQRASACVRPIDGFGTVRRVRVWILGVVRIGRIRVGSAIQRNFRFVRRFATVGAIAIARVRPRRSPLLEPVLGINVRSPVRLFPNRIVPRSESGTRRLVTPRGTIVPRILPVKRPVTATVARRGQVSGQERASASSVKWVRFVVFRRRIARYSPGDLTFHFLLAGRDVTSWLMILVRFLLVIHRQGEAGCNGDQDIYFMNVHVTLRQREF